MRDIGAVIDPERDLREMAERVAAGRHRREPGGARRGMPASRARRRRQAAVPKLPDRVSMPPTTPSCSVWPRAQFALERPCGRVRNPGSSARRASGPRLPGWTPALRAQQGTARRDRAGTDRVRRARRVSIPAKRPAAASLSCCRRPAAWPRPERCSSRWSDRSSGRASSITAPSATGTRSRAATLPADATRLARRPD